MSQEPSLSSIRMAYVLRRHLHFHLLSHSIFVFKPIIFNLRPRERGFMILLSMALQRGGIREGRSQDAEGGEERERR